MNLHKINSKLKLTAIIGKGYGLVALNKIYPGDALLEESPLLLVPLSSDGSIKGFYKNEEFVSPLLNAQIEKLSEEEKSKFFCLTDCTSKTKTNYGILKTNSLTITFKSETFLGLFPKTAFINHSCSPNSNHYWTSSSGKYTVRATTEIEPGTEITISYLSPLQRNGFNVKSSRQKILKDEFGFICSCESCSNIDSLDEDFLRVRISSIEQKIYSTSFDEESFQLLQDQWKCATKLKFQASLLVYIGLHCLEASIISLNKIKDAEDNLRFFSKEILNQGSIAYGTESKESEILERISKMCKCYSTQSELQTNVQKLILLLNTE